MTANESIREYFKVLDEALSDINHGDEFYALFLNAIKSGNNTFYQKLVKERRVFDDKWVAYIEDAIPAIDAIVRNPKSFIKIEREVVAVERAKKVDSESVKHLSANTQFIKEVTEDGDVIPSKILTPYAEEELAIYENRFIKTLIDRLYQFVDRRYNLIMESKPSNFRDQLKINSSFSWFKTDVDLELNINVMENIETEGDKATDLLARIERIRRFAVSFKNSQFMRALANSRPVNPPIMKTNILLKNVQYKQAYKLWLFLDVYTTLGFDVEILEKNLPFDSSYTEDVFNLIVASYSTMFVNQNLGELDYDLNTFRKRRIKRPKITKQLDLSSAIQPNEYQMEDTRISEYFYQKTHQLYSKQYKGMVDEGISKKDALRFVVSELLKLVNTIFEDFVEEQIKEEDYENLFKGDTLENDKIKIKEQRYRLETVRLMKKIKEREYKKILQEEKNLMRSIKKDQTKLARDLERIKKKEQAKKAKEKARLAKKQKEEQEKKRLAALKAKQELEKKRLAEKKAKEEAAKKALEAKRKKEQERLAKEAKKKKVEAKPKVKKETSTKTKASDNIIPLNENKKIEIKEGINEAKENKDIINAPININDPQFDGVDKVGIETDDFGNLTDLGLLEIRRRRLEKIALERRKKEIRRKKRK